ncbi:MAG: hypothetical protein ACM3VT_10995 [Solirubrobacterales bacterium]
MSGRLSIRQPSRARTLLRSRAFTIVEAAISTIIVAVMLVAALTTVGASKTTQHKMALVCRGQLLAEALMAEILQQNYKEPVSTATFGYETGESATSRSAYDDVDDYDGWSASPPTAKDGTTLDNSTNWKETVIVDWTNPQSPNQTSTTETGAKRITVTTYYKNMPQATLVAIKTVDWE